MQGQECVCDGLVQRSVAVSGAYLGGPGGAIWDMGSGERVAAGLPFELGLTAGTPTDFVSVNWETGAGFTIPVTGEAPQPIAVPLAPDDALEHVRSIGTDVYIVSVMGEAWRIRGTQVEPAAAPEGQIPEQSTVPAELSRFGADECHLFEDYLYGWNEDGLLLAMHWA
jgi:hypothetical protein